LKKGNNIFYYKNDYGLECDFIIGDKKKINAAYQVCYDLNVNNEKREISGLIEAIKKFKLQEGIIITKSQEFTKKVDGCKIKCVPFWKWAGVGKLTIDN